MVTSVLFGVALIILPSNVFASDPVLQIATVTPGAINLDVTQSNIHSTICVSGYTASIRPSSIYTTKLKKLQLSGPYAIYKDSKTSDFEEDHLISLEIGGSPTSVLNLWPEPYAGARLKDILENKLHELVCSDTLALDFAQQAISSNWYAVYEKYVLNMNLTILAPGGVAAGASSPSKTNSSILPTPISSLNPILKSTHTLGASSLPARVPPITQSFLMPFLLASNMEQVFLNWNTYGFLKSPVINVNNPVILGDTCAPWEGSGGLASLVYITEPRFGNQVTSQTQVFITLFCQEIFNSNNATATSIALPDPGPSTSLPLPDPGPSTSLPFPDPGPSTSLALQDPGPGTSPGIKTCFVNGYTTKKGKVVSGYFRRC